MKTKPVAILHTFIITCFIAQFSLAQQDKRVDKTFDLEIINYSDQPDGNLEHFHLLKVKNNSANSLIFKLSSYAISCDNNYNNIIENKNGKVENGSNGNSNKKNSNDLSVDFYTKNSKTKFEEITLSSNEVVEFYVKTTRQINAEVNNWNCNKIVASISGAKQNIKKYVVIRSYNPDPTISGE